MCTLRRYVAVRRAGGTRQEPDQPAFWVKSVPVSNMGQGLESRFASGSVWPEQRGALGIDLGPGCTTGQVVVDDAQGLHRRVHGCWSDEAEPALAEVLRQRR